MQSQSRDTLDLCLKDGNALTAPLVQMSTSNDDLQVARQPFCFQLNMHQLYTIIVLCYIITLLDL